MGLLTNRAKANTSTVGTGAVTPGSAVSPFQTWSASGAISGISYDYLIEFGTAWECGTGLYNGTTITRPGPGVDPNFESSTGSLLSLSGTGATIANVENKNTAGQGGNPLVGFPQMPALSGFTQFGMGGTKFVTEVPGQGLIIGDTSGGSSLAIHGVAKTHGLTPPYRVALLSFVTGRQVSYFMPWAGFRQSSDGKIIGLFPLTAAGGWEYQTWASPTSRNSGSGATNSAVAPPSNRPIYSHEWWGIRNDGTNFYLEVSSTGHNADFFVVGQAPLTGQYISVYDQIAFGMFEQSVSGFSFNTVWRTYDPNGLTRTF